MNPKPEDLLLRAECVLACSHVRPDGDAVSSLLAMGWALNRLGKMYTLVCPNRVPATFRFLPGWERITQDLTSSSDYDLIVALDVTGLDRLDHLEKGIRDLAAPILVVDHHVTNTRFGQANWVEPDASATAEVLFCLLHSLGLQLDQVAATYLLTGIVADTQGFRTASTSSRTMEIVGALLKAGASLSAISERALNRRSFAALRLWAAVLPSVRLQDSVVWAEIPLSVRRASGYRGGDDADLVEFLITVEEAVAAAMLYELEDGTVKLSLRSRPGIDVAQVAQQLGGGGHEQAAGATMEGPLEAARQRVLDLLVPQASA